MKDSERSLPSKSEIFDYWKDKLHLRGIFIDWGEPSCWACGWGWNGRYDVKDNARMSVILKAWDKTKPLQRCHIVPHSLGGSDELYNLFLMCKQCHDLAPNTTDSEVFFTWVGKQDWIRRLLSIVREELETFNLSEEKLETLVPFMDSIIAGKQLLPKVGIHFPQSGYSSIASRLTISSVIGLLSTCLDSNRVATD